MIVLWLMCTDNREIANTADGLADADYLFGWNKISWSTGWPVLE